MPRKIITCHSLDKKLYEVDSDELIFRPSVYGILIEEGKILLSKQFDGYDFPGGGINIGETIDEALKREFFEETGLFVEPVRPIHCETTFFKPSHSRIHRDEFWNCPLIYFLVNKTGGEISKNNFDIEEQGYADLPEWFDLDAIKELKYVNSVDSIKIIEKAFLMLGGNQAI